MCPYSYDIPEGMRSASADPAASVVTLFESHNHRISFRFCTKRHAKKKRVFANLCAAVFVSFYSPKAAIMPVLCTSFAPDLPLFNAPAAVQTPSQGRHSAQQPACVRVTRSCCRHSSRSLLVRIRGAIKSIFPLLVVLQCWPASPAQCGGAEVQQRRRMIRSGGGEERNI